MGLGFIFITIIAVMDLSLDPGLSFIILYLSPVFLVTWFGGFWIGSIANIICAALWFFDDKIFSISGDRLLIPLWNLSIKLLFFMVFVYIISLLRKSLEKEKHFAREDSLTGLVNRRFFYEFIKRELGRLSRYGCAFTFGYIDVDNFKKLNDSFGHAAGDDFLASVGKILKKTLRDTDVAARLGGDEFGVLLVESGYEQAELAFKRINSELLAGTSKKGFSATLSMGVVTYLSAPQTIDDIIKTADDLMYSAKNQGKNMIKHITWKKENQEQLKDPDAAKL